MSADAAEIDLDLSGTSREFFLQDVVKRSQTLSYISIADIAMRGAVAV
jgi:hypothetical protein